ncbi:autotransporter family protein [Hydrogenovibrio kuenenii]|uniref:autotransporter family protein n=1 Tax=Hydrogenovibrio kuenenii TaxID=63658 RepID=UPI000467AB78|nr:autotransporter outer membrane beta-barrel domain-containing protein [Hydrogenovibrio kuenenii]
MFFNRNTGKEVGARIFHTKLKPLIVVMSPLMALSTNYSASAAVIDYADGENKTGAITLTNNATQFQVTNGGATQSGNVQGGYVIEKIGAGKLTLSGDNLTTGIVVSQGTLQIIDNAIYHTGDITNNATLELGVTSPLTTYYVNKVISGTGDFVKTGAGGLALNKANTYTGITTVTEGTLNVTGSIASTTVNVDTGGKLQVGGSSIADAAALTLSGTGDLSLTGSETIGSLASASGTSTVIIYSNKTLTTGDAADTTFAGVISDGGAFASDIGNLAKTGTGTFTLTGANTYTGTTTVTEGTLNVTGSIASTTVNVDTGGKLQVGGSSIADAAALTLNGTGQLQITSSETIGSLASASGTSTVTLGANTLTTGDATDTTFAGVASGTGGLTKTGTGTFTLTGANTYTGGTTIMAGTLQIGSGGSIGSITGDIANNSKLTFNRSDVLTYGNVISGTGSLTKLGAGSLNLSNANTYTGTTTVNAGTLSVNGSIINSTTTVNTGGALGGNGTVGSVYIAGGTVAPGNSIGTLNVNGNVDFSAGGVYAVEIDDAGNTDLIKASGTATLTNGTINVKPKAGSYGGSTNYTVLTAAGGLGGTTFSGVSSSLAFVTPTLSYDANNVYLNIRRNSTRYSQTAVTPNQVAVGAALDSIYNSGNKSLNDIYNNLNVLTEKGARQAYDSLSGVQLNYSNLAALQSVGQFKGLLFARIGQKTSMSANNQRHLLAYNQGETMIDVGPQLFDDDQIVKRDWWLRGSGNFGDISSNSESRGARYSTGGVGVGADWGLSNKQTIGVAFGYSHTNTDVEEASLNVNSYQVALYGKKSLDNNYYISAVTGVGYHHTKANRTVNVGTTNQTAKSDFDSQTMNVSIEGGHTFELSGKAMLTPFAGLEYTHIKREGFTEHGAGSSNLQVGEESQNSLKSSIGARVEKIWITAKGYHIKPSAELAWVRELADDQASFYAGFGGVSDILFNVKGVKLDRNRARAGLGVNAAFSEESSFDLKYQGEIAESDVHHNISATFKMKW